MVACICVVGCSCGRCSFTWGFLSRSDPGSRLVVDSNPDSDHLSHVGCDPDSGLGAHVNGGGGGGCDLLMTISAVTFTITSSRFQIFVCGDVAGHLAGP